MNFTCRNDDEIFVETPFVFDNTVQVSDPYIRVRLNSISDFYLISWTSHDKAHGGCWFWEWTALILTEAKLSDKVGKEQEHLRLSQSHSKALSTSNKERNQSLILGKVATFINKSLRLEFLRFLPVGGIIENIVEEGEDCSSSGNIIISNLGILEVHVRGANEVDSCDSHNLMDEGIGVWQSLHILHSNTG